MSDNTAFSVWDYFDKHDTDNKMAVCKLCENVYSYKTTSHNLINHLQRKHKDKFCEISLRPRTHNKNTSSLWKYFTKLDDYKKVLCNVCNNFIPFNRTLSALKSHLEVSHQDVYDKLNEDLPCDVNDFCEEEYLDQNEDSNDSNTTDLDMWSYFERLPGNRAKCVVCCAKVANSTIALKRHLKRNHPKLLSEPFSEQDVEDRNSEPDADKMEGEVYTEVVYLDSEFKNEPKKETQKRKIKTNAVTDKRKRHDSASSDETVNRRAKNKAGDEIEIFTAYITCLLKKMPKDACMKLQMEIINLIMNANLKLSCDNRIVSVNERVIVEGNSIQSNTSGVSYVLVPHQVDMNKQNTLQSDKIIVNTQHSESLDNNVDSKIVPASFSSNGFTFTTSSEKIQSDSSKVA